VPGSSDSSPGTQSTHVGQGAPRLSDAEFVTLVITVRDPDLPRFAALQRALLSISGVRVFAVDSSGNATPLEGLAPERLPEIARSNVKL
jgi:hypothetical protein